LRVVAHAGETTGPAGVWGALQQLQAERIGHGVRALEDPQLVSHLKQTQIPLEVSPVSNYCLKVVPENRPHPIRLLVEQGVYVTVNSDDPPMFSTSLTNEYLLLAKQGFTWAELWQLNLNALHASFLAEDDKASYGREWQAFAQEVGNSSV
jgi:adenosine deaminase